MPDTIRINFTVNTTAYITLVNISKSSNQVQSCVNPNKADISYALNAARNGIFKLLVLINFIFSSSRNGEKTKAFIMRNSDTSLTAGSKKNSKKRDFEIPTPRDSYSKNRLPQNYIYIEISQNRLIFSVTYVFLLQP